ncbi:MAG: hypothetical protein ACK4GQ_00750 [Candidatus Hadarchaeales archaeon]
MPESPILSGRLIFQYLYDVGGDIEMEKIPKEKFTLVERPKKRGDRILAPRHEEVGLIPLEVDLGAVKIDKHRAMVEGKIFSIGVVEISISVEFRKLTFDGLIRLTGLNEGKVKFEGKDVDFDEIPLKFMMDVKKEISKIIVHPYPTVEQPQVYTTVVITESDPRLDAQDFLTKFRKQTAGVLRGEKEWRELSGKEVEDALKAYLSYTDDDIIIVDWYSSLISGAVDYMDDFLGILELALIQLLELRTYDRLLDIKTTEAYLATRTLVRKRPGFVWGRQYMGLMRTMRELAEFRIEITDLIEDARNIQKLTGEWYLGKLYRLAGERFRISEWLTTVDRKLERLEDLYGMVVERIDIQRSTSMEILTLLLIFLIVMLEVLMVVGRI